VHRRPEREETHQERSKSMTIGKERRDLEKKEKARRKREKRGREKGKLFGANIESRHDNKSA